MHNETVLGLTKSDKIILIIFPPLLGALVGWFLPTLAGWAAKIPFIPFGGPLEWISEADNNWIPFIGLIIGLIAGIFFTMYAFYESLKITIANQELKLNILGKNETLTKNQISAAFAEGKQLVLLGKEGMELFRGEIEEKKDIMEEAFKQHGYPWKAEDPFKTDYQRWVVNHPDVPSHVNTLLSARERALKNDQKAEAEALRKDLAQLGVIIRDEEKRQYIRIIRS